MPSPARPAWPARTVSGWTSWQTAGSAPWPEADADGLDLDAAALMSEPAPVRRRVLLKGAAEVADGREVGLDTSRPRSRSSAGPSGGADVPAARWNFGAENWSYSESGESLIVIARPKVITLIRVLRPRQLVGRVVLNSTLRSLVFWMVLVVIGVLVWNFSTKFQNRRQRPQLHASSWTGRSGQVDAVTITGNEITGAQQGRREPSAATPRLSTRGWPTS